MDVEVLESIGLSKGESRVYIALLSLGTTSVGAIIKEAPVARSKVYDILERLQEKGLVSVIVEGKRKRFSAVPPKRITEFLEQQKNEVTQREQSLQKILPQLAALTPKKKRTSAELLTGPRGIRTFYDMSLYNNPQKEEVLVLGYSKEASVYFHAYFRQYHKERIRRKIPGRVIYEYDTWFLKKREKRKYVEQRYLPKHIKKPAFVWIFGAIVGTIVFTKEQKVCFMIKNKTVAQSYRGYFNMLWKQSKKTGK